MGLLPWDNEQVSPAEAIERLGRYLREHPAIRIACTPAAARLECIGCFDGDNVRSPHPDPQQRPRRCEVCPVLIARGAHGQRGSVVKWS